MTLMPLPKRMSTSTRESHRINMYRSVCPSRSLGSVLTREMLSRRPLMPLAQNLTLLRIQVPKFPPFSVSAASAVC